MAVEDWKLVKAMVRMVQERILLVADTQRQMETALAAALPGAQVTAVGSFFDAIAELSSGSFTAILASVEPIERRPESAVRTLHELAADARLVLFGHPTLEPLSRKMLEFGCDDYVITPASVGELQLLFGSPLMRLAAGGEGAAVEEQGVLTHPTPSHPAEVLLTGLPVAELVAECLLSHPSAAGAALVARVNELIGPGMKLALAGKGAAAPAMPAEFGEGGDRIVHSVRDAGSDVAQLHLFVSGENAGENSGATAGRHFMARLADLLGKVHVLQERHDRLLRLATTDELTSLYNARYFRHFLARIIEKARNMRFPVTLLLFDIDDFKKYNDQYGHAMGDEILRQTAALMKRCCREHDLVARIGGDEFAVVFWEKDGPRQPREAKGSSMNGPGRPPQTVIQIIERFRKLIAGQNFSGLGMGGKGTLTVSGGLAQFPYDGREVEELIGAADRDLIFGAKKSGKNTIFLVGGEALEREA